MKWYIVIEAQFKKMVTTDQGTLEERVQSIHLSTPTFKAFNQLDIDTDLPLTRISSQSLMKKNAKNLDGC